MNRCLILDIDNCIANDGWRIQFIDWSQSDSFLRYHRYHSLAHADSAGNHDLFLGREEGLLLLTSRPVHYRAETERWLAIAGVRWRHLLMRNNFDFRPSVAMKRAQLRSLIEYGVDAQREVLCAYDDRPEICAMYREEGLRAEVRAIHNVSAYTHPTTKVNHADGTRTDARR